MKLEDYLRHHALHFPDKTAVICRGETYTYSQLFDMVTLRACGIRSDGGVVPFRATQDIDFLVTYFAVHMADAVAAPLGADIPKAAFDDVVENLKDCVLPKDSADVLFTTGTTGQAKGVVVSHRAILANAENLIGAQQYAEDLTFIICGPLNHIGSLSKIYPIIMLGATLHILDGLKDINAFYSALAYSDGKMATFLVPASIRMLIKFSAERLASFAEKIDFIETGAAPISRNDMLELCRLLPKSRLYNTYASTETGIISTYNFNDGQCVESCVGRVMRHSSVEINEDGVIVCGGTTLMSGYVTGNGNDVIVDGQVVTRDSGTIDDKGMLHLLGRNDDVINVGGFKVVPDEVENAVLAMEGISDCICIAINHPIAGTALKLLFVPESGVKIDKYEIAKFLRSKLELHKVPLFYECVPQIKRTFNGKLDRKAYKG